MFVDRCAIGNTAHEHVRCVPVRCHCIYLTIQRIMLDRYEVCIWQCCASEFSETAGIFHRSVRHKCQSCDGSCTKVYHRHTCCGQHRLSRAPQHPIGVKVYSDRKWSTNAWFNPTASCLLFMQGMLLIKKRVSAGSWCWHIDARAHWSAIFQPRHWHKIVFDQMHCTRKPTDSQIVVL